MRARFPDCLSSHCAAVGGPVFRRCALRVLAPSALRASDGQRPGRESIFPFRTVPQFSMVVPLRSQARLWHSLLHWAYSALFRAQRARFVRPSPSLARCSGTAAALWACPRASSRFAAFDCALRFAPCARHFSPSGLHLFARHLLPKNTRNDVHAVISD